MGEYMSEIDFLQFLRNKKAAMVVAGLNTFKPAEVYGDPKWKKYNKALTLLDRSFKK
jgi:hypothetical protein